MDFLTSLWKHDEYLSPVVEFAEQVSILSLDIFDTLLLRTCQHPTDVFAEVARSARQSGLVRNGLSPHEFQQIRILAESRARSRNKALCGSREVNLSEIYQAMPANIGDRTALMALERTECARLDVA